MDSESSEIIVPSPTKLLETRENYERSYQEEQEKQRLPHISLRETIDNSLYSAGQRREGHERVGLEEDGPKPPPSRRRVIVTADRFEAVDKAASETNFESIRGKEGIDNLAEKLGTFADTNLEKVRAAFVWLAKHKSDLRALHKSRVNSKRRLSFQENITPGDNIHCAIFIELCSRWNIPCTSVKGRLKGIQYRHGADIDKNHQWCVVLIDGAYRIVDPRCGSIGIKNYSDETWSLDRSNTLHSPEDRQELVTLLDDDFFFMDPEVFIYDHFADLAEWQLLPTPVSYDQFKNMALIRRFFFELGFIDTNYPNYKITPHEGQVKIILTNRRIMSFECGYSLHKHRVSAPQQDMTIERDSVKVTNIGSKVHVDVQLGSHGFYKLSINAHSSRGIEIPLVEYIIEYGASYEQLVLSKLKRKSGSNKEQHRSKIKKEDNADDVFGNNNNTNDNRNVVKPNGSPFEKVDIPTADQDDKVIDPSYSSKDNNEHSTKTEAWTPMRVDTRGEHDYKIDSSSTSSRSADLLDSTTSSRPHSLLNSYASSVASSGDFGFSPLHSPSIHSPNSELNSDPWIMVSSTDPDYLFTQSDNDMCQSMDSIPEECDIVDETFEVFCKSVDSGINRKSLQREILESEDLDSGYTGLDSSDNYLNKTFDNNDEAPTDEFLPFCRVGNTQYSGKTNDKQDIETTNNNGYLTPHTSRAPKSHATASISEEQSTVKRDPEENKTPEPKIIITEVPKDRRTTDDKNSKKTAVSELQNSESRPNSGVSTDSNTSYLDFIFMDIATSPKLEHKEFKRIEAECQTTSSATANNSTETRSRSSSTSGTLDDNSATIDKSDASVQKADTDSVGSLDVQIPSDMSNVSDNDDSIDKDDNSNKVNTLPEVNGKTELQRRKSSENDIVVEVEMHECPKDVSAAKNNDNKNATNKVNKNNMQHDTTKDSEEYEDALDTYNKKKDSFEWSSDHGDEFSAPLTPLGDIEKSLDSLELISHPSAYFTAPNDGKVTIKIGNKFGFSYRCQLCLIRDKTTDFTEFSMVEYFDGFVYFHLRFPVYGRYEMKILSEDGTFNIFTYIIKVSFPVTEPTQFPIVHGCSDTEFRLNQPKERYLVAGTRCTFACQVTRAEDVYVKYTNTQLRLQRAGSTAYEGRITVPDNGDVQLCALYSGSDKDKEVVLAKYLVVKEQQKLEHTSKALMGRSISESHDNYQRSSFPNKPLVQKSLSFSYLGENVKRYNVENDDVAASLQKAAERLSTEYLHRSFEMDVAENMEGLLGAPNNAHISERRVASSNPLMTLDEGSSHSVSRSSNREVESRTSNRDETPVNNVEEVKNRTSNVNRDVEENGNKSSRADIKVVINDAGSTPNTKTVKTPPPKPPRTPQLGVNRKLQKSSAPVQLTKPPRMGLGAPRNLDKSTNNDTHAPVHQQPPMQNIQDNGKFPNQDPKATATDPMLMKSSAWENIAPSYPNRSDSVISIDGSHEDRMTKDEYFNSPSYFLFNLKVLGIFMGGVIIVAIFMMFVMKWHDPIGPET